MNRRSLLKSALLAPVAFLAAKLGARAVGPEKMCATTAQFDDYVPLMDLSQVDLTTEEKVRHYRSVDGGPMQEISVEETTQIKHYKLVNGELVELIHPYDLYDLFNRERFTLDELFTANYSENRLHGKYDNLIKFRGKLYLQTTAVMPRTKRIA